MRAIRFAVTGVLIAFVVGAVTPRALGGSSEALDSQWEPARPPWLFRLADVRVELETHSFDLV